MGEQTSNFAITIGRTEYDMENYVNFAVEKTVELLAIDSPTGYTAAAEEYVLREKGHGHLVQRKVNGEG